MDFQVLVIGKVRGCFGLNGRRVRAVRLYVAYEPRFSVGFINEVDGLCLGEVYVASELWSKISIGNCYCLTEPDGDVYKNALCLDYNDICESFKNFYVDFAGAAFI